MHISYVRKVRRCCVKRDTFGLSSGYESQFGAWIPFLGLHIMETPHGVINMPYIDTYIYMSIKVGDSELVT